MADETAYKSMLPRTGKIIKSDGTIFNEADSSEVLYEASTAPASRIGGVFRSFFYDVSLADGTHEFVIDIPAGIVIFGIDRVTTVFDGRVESEFLIADGFTDGTYSRVGDDFNELLEQQSQSILKKITTGSLTNESTRTPPIPIISPTTGPVRSSSAQTVGGFHPKFDITHLPVFRYNISNGPLEFYLQLTWQEFPA